MFYSYREIVGDEKQKQEIKEPFLNMVILLKLIP